MLPNITRVAQAARLISRLQPVRCMSDHVVLRPVRERAIEVQATMDHMLKPEGDWQEDFNSRNKKYNMNLVASIVAFIGTSIVLSQVSDVFEYRNPGKKPYNIYDHLGVNNPEVDASVENLKEILKKMD